MLQDLREISKLKVLDHEPTLAKVGQCVWACRACHAHSVFWDSCIFSFIAMSYVMGIIIGLVIPQDG